MGTFETHYELLRARAEHHVCDPTDILSAVVTKLARWCVRWCTPNRCLSCMCSAIVLFLFGVCSLCFFAASMTACDPERLEQQAVPNAGNILPDHVWLETRWWTWFGCLQQLDVYAADPPSKALGSRIGQFYAARIPLLYFAVSYQDLDGRVWLSARSPGFFERVNWLGLEYMVERCDAPAAGTPPAGAPAPGAPVAGAPAPGVLRVVQAWEASPSAPQRVYYLKYRTADGHVSYGTSTLGYRDVSRVTFEYDFPWVRYAEPLPSPNPHPNRHSNPNSNPKPHPNAFPSNTTWPTPALKLLTLCSTFVRAALRPDAPPLVLAHDAMAD